jgi:hypothetical protein
VYAIQTEKILSLHGGGLALYDAAIYLIYLPFCINDKVFNLAFFSMNTHWTRYIPATSALLSLLILLHVTGKFYVLQ